MAAFDDDDRPKKRSSMKSARNLSLISVAELNERIALLRGRNCASGSGYREETIVAQCSRISFSRNESQELCASHALHCDALRNIFHLTQT